MKLGKKDILAYLLMKFGFIWLINRYNRLFKKRLLILAYHRVLDIKCDPSEFLSDIELVSASSQSFRWQINYLKDNYTVVTFPQYLVLKNENKLVGDIVIITFDDGFKDNYDTAYPILKEHGIPAVFFVSTDYIGKHERFWFEFLVSGIQQTPDPYLEGACSVLGVKSLSDKDAIAESALKHLKEISDSDRSQVILNFKQFLSDNKIILQPTDATPMSWDDLREMQDNGMEIGSHTKSHPVLTNTDPEHCLEEISGSKTLLDSMLQKPCISISYPNGQLGEFDQNIMDLVKSSGYEYASSYISGTNTHAKALNYELRRLHVERYTSNSYFASSLALPSIFS